MKYPAQLVPFEKLMYFLDQPNFPNSLGIRLWFDGVLDRSAAVAAAEATFARHPGFQVKIDPDRLQFIDNQEPFRNYRWIELNSPEERHPLAPTEIHGQGGGMFWFVNHPGGCSVALIGHHALTDGVGGLQVISEWLLDYHRRISGEPLSLPKLNPQLLFKRGDLDILSRRFLRKLAFQPICLFGASKFILRKSAPLLPESSSDATQNPPEPYPHIVTLRLSTERTEKITAWALEHRGTPNDVFATALFVALSRWRERHATQDERDWIRLLVPLSIRTIADRRLTACNRVSMVQVDRQPRQMKDLVKLFASVARELRVIREWQLDRTLLLALRALSWIPGQLKRMAKNPRGRATSLLTNLGNPFDRLPLAKSEHCVSVGNLRLNRVELVAPMLRGVPVAFALTEFLKQWRICLNFDERLVTYAQANELLEQFDRAIGELISGNYNKEK